MSFRNTKDTYGLVARILHWSMAIGFLAMFGFGKWMRTLDYYSPYYYQAPHLHKIVGLFLVMVLVFRLVWRVTGIRPDDSYLKPVEQKASTVMHWLFYLGLSGLMLSGYLVATSDGHTIDFLGWVTLPSVPLTKETGDSIFRIHEILGGTVLALAGIHAAAALKHHFLDHDVTLRRMLKGSAK